MAIVEVLRVDAEAQETETRIGIIFIFYSLNSEPADSVMIKHEGVDRTGASEQAVCDLPVVRCLQLLMTCYIPPEFSNTTDFPIFRKLTANAFNNPGHQANE